eukprot:2699383-Pyramimonas_sp.AAC.1
MGSYGILWDLIGSYGLRRGDQSAARRRAAGRADGGGPPLPAPAPVARDPPDKRGPSQPRPLHY